MLPVYLGLWGAHLDLLPVGPASGVQEVRVNVVFLVGEVGFRGDVDHPRAAVTTHTQMQHVERGPVVVLSSVKGGLREESFLCSVLGRFYRNSCEIFNSVKREAAIPQTYLRLL